MSARRVRPSQFTTVERKLAIIRLTPMVTDTATMSAAIATPVRAIDAVTVRAASRPRVPAVAAASGPSDRHQQRRWWRGPGGPSPAPRRRGRAKLATSERGNEGEERGAQTHRGPGPPSARQRNGAARAGFEGARPQRRHRLDARGLERRRDRGQGRPRRGPGRCALATEASGERRPAHRDARSRGR